MVTLPSVNIDRLYRFSLIFIQLLMPKVTSAIEERLKRGESPSEVFLSELLVRPAGNSSEDKGLVHLWAALYHLAEGQNEAALKECSEARQQLPPDSGPIIYFFEAHAFSYLRRYDEAFSCFATSFFWRSAILDSLQGGSDMAPVIHQWQEDFYKSWTLPGLAQGLEGLVMPSRKAWTDGAEKVAAVLRQAQEEGKEDAVWSVVTQIKESLPPEFQYQVQEFRAFIELIAIEDPFEGLRALAKSISAVWPKDVDCVEAVREQRR